MRPDDPVIAIRTPRVYTKTGQQRRRHAFPQTRGSSDGRRGDRRPHLARRGSARRSPRRWDHEPQLQGGRGGRPVRAPHRRTRYRGARDRPRGGARGGSCGRRGRRRAGGRDVRRARGLPRDALHRGLDRAARGDARAGLDQARGAGVAAVHRGPSLPARFNSFRVVEDYRTTAFSHGAEVPPSYAWARQVARRVERARGAFAERPCHNDLLNANFIDDGRRLRIVDWEYAGMGDVFFDLANFSINHGLDRDGREALLEAYFGEVEHRTSGRSS